MPYAAETDPLCYPGTSVLINRGGLTGQTDLDEFELSMYLTRADEPFPQGDLGYGHYRAIHHHLFQDVYDWAGQSRTIRIGKGGNWFCYPEHLEREMAKAFAGSVIDSAVTSPTKTIFAERAALLLAEINAGHPFREGNGRTQMAYLKLLAATAGYGFNEDALNPDVAMSAMIASFAGELAGLARLIEDLIR
jgi:cell filamentation protein